MKPGEIVHGRYRIIERIGRGGTADVFRVMDQVINEQRALKLLSAMSASARAKLGRRLRTEAQILSEIAHPNVLRVHAIGDYDQRAWILTDLADCNLLERAREREVSPEVVVGWMLQVLSALALAHDAGVVHRDVKPQNILLDSSGRVVLADFGIALVQDSDIRETRTGVTMGSMEYMPPEQRLDASGVDHRADLYAAGATLYFLMTGQTPVDLFMEGPDSARLARLPPMLRAVVLRATRHAPEARYPDARLMAAALAASLAEVRRMVPMSFTRDQTGSNTLDDTRLALALMGEVFSPAVLPAPPPLAPPPTAYALSAAPLPADEDDRLGALLALALLDSDPEERFDRYTRRAQHLLDVPIALISLVDNDRQWFKSRRGLGARQTPREHAFCAHAILQPDHLLEVNDATVDPRFRDNPLVTGRPDIRFYAGCPIRAPGGQPIGTLCVIDDRPRSLNAAGRSLLRELADQIEDDLREHEAMTMDLETGLSNLQGFKHSARQVMAYCREARAQVTLLHISLEGEADALGFAMGLLESWGDADVIARTGPREFCVMIAGEVSASARMERLRRAMRRPEVDFRWVSVAVDAGSEALLAALMARSEAALNQSSTPASHSGEPSGMTR